LENLYDQGIRHYRADQRSVPELAVAAARPVVDGLAGSSVDMLVYCTDTPSDHPITRQMWQVQRDIGLIDTPSMAVSGGGCSNLGTGVQVARAVLATEGLATVLLVTADRVAGPSGRYLTHGATVLSDSAAACVLTAGPIADGFRILGMSTEVRADIDATANQLVRGRAIMQKIGRGLGRASAESGVQPAECRYLLTGNFGRTSRTFLTIAARCTAEQGYWPWVADMGHCFSADILVNLSTLMERSEIDPADRLLLLSSSPHSWSVIIAEYAPA
jgi:3-oxoacyl-[acyl-carrier-protein] synthase-3